MRARRTRQHRPTRREEISRATNGCYRYTVEGLDEDLEKSGDAFEKNGKRPKG